MTLNRRRHPLASVTDSAGIRAVRNAPADRLYAELVEAPILSIGEFSGPSELLFGQDRVSVA